MSDIKKALEHEWFVTYIDKGKFDISFVMINGKDSPMDQFLINNKIPVHYFEYAGKIDIILVTLGIVKILKKDHFDIVHAHLFEASICGMLAASIAGTKTRIITRHHSDYHHTWHPHAVIYDRLINFLTTDIIAISGIVREILVHMEKVNPAKVHLVHHGLDSSLFKDTGISLRAAGLKEKYNIPKDKKIIGAISRLIEWKGVQFIIPAFKKLLESHSDFHLVLANATGIYKNEIDKLLEQLPAGTHTMIDFENDVPALFGLFDYFVHVPVSRESEAFGQVYIEAFFSRIPSVFTPSGIAADIGRNRVNCMLVPFGDSDAIMNSLNYLVLNPDIANEIAENGFMLVKDTFDVHQKIKRLEQIYIKASA